mgnify:CR=1 FL=1
MITLFSENGHVYDVKQGSFPDGTLHLSLPYDKIKYVKWKYESDAELFTLICIRKHYYNSNMDLVLPYIPHARMDRVKVDEDVFTLKYFAEVINSLHFSIVWVRDAHSNVSLALLDRVEDTGVEPYIHKATLASNAEVLFFPDEGAMKRYSDKSPLPYAFGMKKRDWTTGKILGLDIMNAELVKGKNILIIDDICSRGGTFLHAAKALKAAGANRIFLYVTHAEKTMVEGEMYNNLDLVERIYTTDSIFNIEWDDRNKVTIVNEF